MRCILLLLGILALTGCESDLVRQLLTAPEPPIGAQLTTDEIKTTLAGNSLSSTEELVPPLVVYFSENGEMSGVRANNYHDDGTWQARDDALCGTWKNWYGTLANCWMVFRSDSRVTLKSVADARTATTILSPGNAVATVVRP